MDEPDNQEREETGEPQLPHSGMRSAADEPDSMPGDTRGCTVAILVGLLIGLLIVAIIAYLIIRTL